MITVNLNEIPDQLKTIASYRKFPLAETYTEEVIKDQSTTSKRCTLADAVRQPRWLAWTSPGHPPGRCPGALNPVRYPA